MATKLIFQSTERSGINSELVCYLNTNNEIYIDIAFDEINSAFICLDRETAIKLSKTLKSEISKISK